MTKYGEKYCSNYCYGSMMFSGIEQQLGIVFNIYFAKELEKIAPFVKEGLVDLTAEGLVLSEALGRLLARVPAVLFHAYFEDIVVLVKKTGRKSSSSSVG